MSTKELSRLEATQRLSTPALADGAREKQMSQKEAGEILHVSTRQIKRLLKRYRNN